MTVIAVVVVAVAVVLVAKAHAKMKITKRQLRRIIKEEKARLVREMNPDGSISGDEDDARANLLADADERMMELIQHVRDEAERIGGGFRSPGIRAEVFKLLADQIHRAR